MPIFQGLFSYTRVRAKTESTCRSGAAYRNQFMWLATAHSTQGTKRYERFVRDERNLQRFYAETERIIHGPVPGAVHQHVRETQARDVAGRANPCS